MARRTSSGNLLQVFLLLVAVALLGASLWIIQRTQLYATYDREHLSILLNAGQQAKTLGDLGTAASQGDKPDVRRIGAAQEEMINNLRIMHEGDPEAETPLPPLPPQTEEDLAYLDEVWLDMNDSIDLIVERFGSYQTAEQYVFQLRDSMLDLRDSLAPIGDRLTEINASSDQIFLAANQLVSVERIRAGASRVLGSGSNATIHAEGVQSDVESLAEALEALRDSRAGRDAKIKQNIEQALRGIRSARTAAESLVELASDIEEIQEASALLNQLGIEIADAAVPPIQDRLTEVREGRPLKVVHAYIAGAGAVGMLVLFLIVFFISIQRRQRAAERSEKMQQEAILTLLDEISNLADGDLTTTVTVTEDFTGAIADSINYTIETLRTLVGTINSTAGQVAEAAGGTLDTATNLNEASREQTTQITSAAETVGKMADRMQQMSNDAQNLAAQAQTSLETARSGGETVRRTIQGMESLREQIQDTSKRIKRLGESSQEIGNIIEFINDIAEQTNTLALNASIQAAMAGESGKGFAVVADEVQRLAERAGAATKQIESLVKTIQADTNEAIISMERSTTNVVSGARSAEEAGGALERIESFASDLARLIQEISAAARDQAGEATGVAETMQKAREIANQTASAADLTATSTRDLTTLSDQLRETVSGFRLPGEGGMEEALLESEEETPAAEAA